MTDEELSERAALALGWKHGEAGWYNPDGDPSNDGAIYFYEKAPSFNSPAIVKAMLNAVSFEILFEFFPDDVAPEWRCSIRSLYEHTYVRAGDTQEQALARAIVARATNKS